MGGSNGGLLMGATLVQHPDLARAVVSHVGIYDPLRWELQPNGEFNVTEFGSVKDPDQFRALYAYSPFANARDGAAYPAVLFTSRCCCTTSPKAGAGIIRKLASRSR